MIMEDISKLAKLIIQIFEFISEIMSIENQKCIKHCHIQTLYFNKHNGLGLYKPTNYHYQVKEMHLILNDLKSKEIWF